MDDIAVGNSEAMSSPLRPTQDPTQVKNRPSSAGNERKAMAPIPVKVKSALGNIQPNVLANQNKPKKMVKPSRPTDNAGRNRNVAPKGGRAHSRYSQNSAAAKH